MLYGSNLGVICRTYVCYIHELRKKSCREFQEDISAHCVLCSNQRFGFFLLDKSNMVNDDFDCAVDCGVYRSTGDNIWNQDQNE